ncbi:two-component system sensor histidine kinase NtrB [Candidatus Magnetominusculus dajiuhuensis]|uniref:two-component system sensor histidine kinase NtrB n=1 Tax=Candidatus Magnetominusculus dajiuhuensis TaxID=3137712 RepID=UPI003B42A9CE
MFVNTLQTEHRHLHSSDDVDEKKSTSDPISPFEKIGLAILDAFVMMDGTGVIVLWNKKAEAIFGFTQAEAVGRKLHELVIPERYQQNYLIGLRTFGQTGQNSLAGKAVEVEAVKKDGKEFPIELSVSSVETEGQWYAIAIIRYISEKYERLRNEQLRALEVRVLEMDRMAGLSTLSAGLAHEINNPLSIMKASVNYFSKTLAVFEHFMRHTMNLPAPADFIDTYRKLVEEFNIGDSISTMYKKVNMSNRNIERIKEVVDSLKVFSRRDAPDVEDVNINKSIDETLAMLTGMAGGVNVIKEYAVLPLCLCEARAINQCFYQILSNAFRAVKDDGNIKITTSQTSTNAGDIIAITITDDGVGMSEETLKQAFIPFFTTREVGSGKGLGLSIVEGIIKRHSGTIDIESGEGKGTSVTISLPVIQNKMFH